MGIDEGGEMEERKEEASERALNDFGKRSISRKRGGCLTSLIRIAFAWECESGSES